MGVSSNSTNPNRRRIPGRAVGALFGVVALVGISTASVAESVAPMLVDLPDVAAPDGSFSVNEPRPQGRWLVGTYQESMPISREQLSPGLSALTTEQVLELANSREFAQARSAWGDDERFVFQVGYQMEFRSKVDFMSASPSHVARLLLDRPINMGIQQMNLYMSDDEVAEMQRRDALGDGMERIVRELTGVRPDESLPALEGVRPRYGLNYGGIWQDQLDEGRIVLAVVDPHLIGERQLQELVGGEANLKIIEQPFSFDELEEYRDRLEEELSELGLPPHVAAVWGPEGRRLEVTVADPAGAAGKIGKGIPAGVFSIVEGMPFHEAGTPGLTHSLGDQQAGLRIQVYDGVQGRGCTWGFNGHTANLHYIVSAGHCLGIYKNNAGSILPAVDIWQNNSPFRDLTSSPFVVSKDDSSWDVARVASGYADDNCYHGSSSGADGHCWFTMSVRALHNKWELGNDRTCSSLGQSNDYKCGYIVDDDFGPNRIVVDMVTISGDSGSGGQWGNRIDGILTDISPTQTFYQTAYHVQYTLGNGTFYFNCAVGKTVRTNPADWGACPTVDP